MTPHGTPEHAQPHGTPEHAQPHGTPPPHEVPVGPPPFTDAEWQVFREEDKKAGARIVGLIVGIFLVGLVLYIGVALSVAYRAAA
jgi:hypothetical protein